jgi:hypothetical protein
MSANAQGVITATLPSDAFTLNFTVANGPTSQNHKAGNFTPSGMAACIPNLISIYNGNSSELITDYVASNVYSYM